MILTVFESLIVALVEGQRFGIPYSVLFFFFFGCTACGISGIEPASPALEVQSQSLDCQGKSYSAIFSDVTH